MTAIAVLGVVVFLAVAWFLWASRPLSEQEIEAFARRARIVAIEEHFNFRDMEIEANPHFKRSMETNGRLYSVDLPITQFPATAAALLKGKKHEWIIFAYAQGDRVFVIWLNKGPDNKRVWPLMDPHQLLRYAEGLGADTVLDIHNHPNPNPARLSASLPSAQDHVSADTMGSVFASRGITYLAFVTERGRHYQYGCWVPDHLIPLPKLVTQVWARNGKSRLSNLDLRSEHRARSRLVSLLMYKDASHNLGMFR
jgi:hypothetical protein